MQKTTFPTSILMLSHYRLEPPVHVAQKLVLVSNPFASFLGFPLRPEAKCIDADFEST